MGDLARYNLQELALKLGFEYIPKPPDDIQSDLLSLIPPEYALKNQVLPISIDNTGLRVASASPFEPHIADELSLLTGRPIEIVLCEAGSLSRAIDEKIVSRVLEGVSGSEIEAVGDEAEESGDLQQLASEALTVKVVNLIFRQALAERASDIHIEPFERELKLRFRVDGTLIEASPPPKKLQAAVASRIKVLAGLNIAERRLPQDGRMKLRMSGRELDVRVSTVPTLHGESIVMRLLDKSSINLSLVELGMPEKILKGFESAITRPYGIVLVTGPTGSGKTTTLYGALNHIFTIEKKIITIEDPVEYQLPGVNQIAVKPKIDLTFANGLRSILRQDPDVIMVGEIRDAETAEIAIHASLTGHLVLSTIHTNDAASAIARLIDMGIDPYLVASSVAGILAQRLVRVICPECKIPVEVPDEVAAELRACGRLQETRQAAAWKGAGCQACRGKGYNGRRGIFEYLPIDEEIRSLILEKASPMEIKQCAARKGMATLREDGWRAVAEGITSPEEVYRVARGDGFGG